MSASLQKKSIRGLETAWLVAGPESAPLVLLLHGFPDTPNCWDSQIQALSSSYRVIAPYNRGAGLSEPSSSLDRYSLRATTADLLDILQDIDPTHSRPIVVIGHDLGGVFAWDLARHLPERIRGLVIVNSADLLQMGKRWLSSPRQWLKSWYIPTMLIPKISQHFLRRYPTLALKGAYSIGALEASKRPKLSEALKAVVHPSLFYQALALDMMDRSLRREKNRPITAPLLAINSIRDGFVNASTTEELRPLARDIEIRAFDCGHWPHRERSEEFNTIIKSKIDEWMMKP